MKKLIEAYQAAVVAISKRATLKDARHALAAVEREAVGETCYAFSTNTKADFVAYCQREIELLVEVAHAEALEMDAQRDIDNMVEEGGAIQAQIDFYAMTLLSQRAAAIKAAHVEAIAANEGLDFIITALRKVIVGIRSEGLSAREARENVHRVCEGYSVT
ncbi:hypothetical protein CEW81_18210 [Kluyvera genomosp. 3]|uniref:Ead/Ea22-like family protein n=1 Tax=Kluyvera genomosp. 3 TaxID=2774055 RepID=A0A248KKK8_9ENTR|nr:hypothetical protein CEW81_18210 [Kluyvera genomosp. 3]